MSTEVSAPPRAIRRVNHSARTSIPSIDLYEVSSEKRHKLFVVSQSLHSIYVHQSARRPIPCYASDDQHCQHHRLPIKEQHYLFVEVPGNPRLRIVRLTSGLVYQQIPELHDEKRNLNGLMIELWREVKGKEDSALLGTILREESVDKLPRDTPEIEWAVHRMLTAPDRNSPWSKRRSQSARPQPRQIAPPPAPLTMDDLQSQYLRAIDLGLMSAEQAKAKLANAEARVNKEPAKGGEA